MQRGPRVVITEVTAALGHQQAKDTNPRAFAARHPSALKKVLDYLLQHFALRFARKPGMFHHYPQLEL
jgi:hypothetical protein